jgi:phage/conjugal plasmid C-4 type zinc finger TraR family protein
MSDEIDRANDMAEFNLQVALANLAKPAGHVSFEFCDFCGNPIPEARRLAVPGVELCVDCQRDEEFREKYR